MKLRRRVLAGTAVGALVLGFAILHRSMPDPVFHGRNASAWVADLLSPDYTVRGNAQAALLSLGQLSVPAIRVLLQKSSRPWEPYLARFRRWFPFLEDANDPVLCRQRGAEMIARLGPVGRDAVPDLVDSLKYSEVALEAERALVHVGDAAIPGLIDGLRLRNAEIRTRAARLLREFVRVRVDCLPPLIQSLRDPKESVRREAALALGESLSRDLKVTIALAALVKDPSAEVRAASYQALGKLPGPSDSVTEVVREGLHDSNPLVRLEAAKAYWSLTRDCAAVVPVLSGVLPTEEGWQAAYALAAIGPAAASAVPALVEVLQREKVPRAFRTPPSSSFALGQIQEAAIPAVERVLDDPEPTVRVAAVLAFNFMGKHARTAVPRLLKLLQDPEPEVRHVTAITLASAGADRELVLSGLTDCLRAEDIYMRSTAAALLREIAPEVDWGLAPE